MRVVGRRRGLEGGGPAQPPGGDLHPGSIEPTLDLVHQLDAIALLARLKIEALGAHVVVERGERDKLPLAALDHDERRADAVGSVAAEQVAAAERIAEQRSE